MTLAIISAYLVGYVLCYLLARYIFRKEWTIARRTETIILSLFSWLLLVLMVLVLTFKTLKKLLNDNSIAGW